MKNGGFSILELVMVIVIIGCSFLGLVVAMQASATNMHKPKVIAIATALAEEQMERMMTISFSSLASQTSQNFSGNMSAYSYTVTVTNIDANDKRVVVTVSNPVINSLSLAMLRTNY
ncbi:MAG: hypothetical protein HQL13_03035 [Candidatus Omnitrophica bacterium]|nr:hypothetical protein [Candidatus Omnitrophota bacterium]